MHVKRESFTRVLLTNMHNSSNLYFIALVYGNKKRSHATKSERINEHTWYSNIYILLCFVQCDDGYASLRKRRSTENGKFKRETDASPTVMLTANPIHVNAN